MPFFTGCYPNLWSNPLNPAPFKASSEMNFWFLTFVKLSEKNKCLMDVCIVGIALTDLNELTYSLGVAVSSTCLFVFFYS